MANSVEQGQLSHTSQDSAWLRQESTDWERAVSPTLASAPLDRQLLHDPQRLPRLVRRINSGGNDLLIDSRGSVAVLCWSTGTAEALWIMSKGPLTWVETTGLEPVTPCLQSRCAASCATPPGIRGPAADHAAVPVT